MSLKGVCASIQSYGSRVLPHAQVRVAGDDDAFGRSLVGGIVRASGVESVVIASFVDEAACK